MNPLKSDLLEVLRSGNPTRADYERLAKAHPDEMHYRTALAQNLLSGEWLGGLYGADVPQNWTINPNRALEFACGLIKAAKRLKVGRFAK